MERVAALLNKCRIVQAYNCIIIYVTVILHNCRLLYTITTKFGKCDKLLNIYQINRRVYTIPNQVLHSKLILLEIVFIDQFHSFANHEFVFSSHCNKNKIRRIKIEILLHVK